MHRRNCATPPAACFVNRRPTLDGRAQGLSEAKLFDDENACALRGVQSLGQGQGQGRETLPLRFMATVLHVRIGRRRNALIGAAFDGNADPVHCPVRGRVSEDDHLPEPGVCWFDPNVDPNQRRFRGYSPNLAEPSKPLSSWAFRESAKA
jgi:hypothetical protein